MGRSTALASLLVWLIVAGPSAGPAVGTPEPPSPGAVLASPAPAPVRPATSGWLMPLRPDPTVVRGFEAPPQPWAPGHRGVDLTAGLGQQVMAPAPGRVAFAGMVAGRGVMTLEHADGVLTSYEPVRALLPSGTSVGRGQPVAELTAGPGHCEPATCLHWGARRPHGTSLEYFDPLTLLQPFRPPPPPVLLPLSGPGGSGFGHRAV
jgi:murein DD-endopeptidase MepM/ murein hydrolase activator NlpD